jgi:hypothetical protein
VKQGEEKRRKIKRRGKGMDKRKCKLEKERRG